MGFITGSLGVVWPWKKTIYKQDNFGEILVDDNGSQVIENYQRYLPEINFHTITLILFIVFGVCIILGLDWYGKKRKKYI
jgi:hypothetical protein